jgi:hypothetical protein
MENTEYRYCVVCHHPIQVDYLFEYNGIIYAEVCHRSPCHEFFVDIVVGDEEEP